MTGESSSCRRRTSRQSISRSISRWSRKRRCATRSCATRSCVTRSCATRSCATRSSRTKGRHRGRSSSPRTTGTSRRRASGGGRQTKKKKKAPPRPQTLEHRPLNRAELAELVKDLDDDVPTSLEDYVDIFSLGLPTPEQACRLLVADKTVEPQLYDCTTVKTNTRQQNDNNNGEADDDNGEAYYQSPMSRAKILEFVRDPYMTSQYREALQAHAKSATAESLRAALKQLGLSSRSVLTRKRLNASGLLSSMKLLPWKCFVHHILPRMYELRSMDVSGNHFGEARAKAFADALREHAIGKTMGTLTSLNISNNDIGRLVLSKGWTKGEGRHATLNTMTWYKHTDGREQKEHPGCSPQGVIAMANAIPAMEALKTLDISNNAVGAVALAEGVTFRMEDPGDVGEEQFFWDKDNECLGREPPPGCGQLGLTALADALKNGAGALVSLNLSNNELYAGGGKTIADALKDNQVLTELNLARNKLQIPLGSIDPSLGGEFDMSGAVAIAKAIPTMGALAKLVFGGDEYFHIHYGEDVTPEEPVVLELNMTRADLGDKGLQEAGAIIVGAWIAHKDNGALTSVNILNNYIGTDQAIKLIEIMASKPNLTTLCGFSGDETELDLSDKNLSGECAVLVANEVKNNRALVKLDASANGMFGYSNDKSAINAWADVLKTNSTLLELNLARNDMSADDAKIFANGVSANGAMTSLDISANRIVSKSGWMEPPRKGLREGDLVDGNPVVEIDSDGDIKVLHLEGVNALADAIKNNGALEKLNISNNKLFDDDAGAGKILSDMLAANTTLKELDVSSSAAYGTASKGGSLFARELAVGLSTNGALVKFDISKNMLFASGTKALAEGLKGNQVMTELKISENYIGFKDRRLDADMSGVIAISDAIPTMGALTSLNICNNSLLNKESGKALADALKENSVLKELDVSNNYEHVRSSQDGAGFAQELTVGLSTNGAMTSLNISNNMLCGFYSDGSGGPYNGEGIKAISSMLETNKVLTELDISKNCMKGEGSQVLADGLSANGALKKLLMGGNRIYAEGCKALAEALEGNGALTELNLSHCELSRSIHGNADLSGLVALTGAVKKSTTLTLLDVREEAHPPPEEALLPLKNLCNTKGIRLELTPSPPSSHDSDTSHVSDSESE